MTETMWGACSKCGRIMRVTNAGVVGYHVDMSAPTNGLPWHPRCAGAGLAPTREGKQG